MDQISRKLWVLFQLLVLRDPNKIRTKLKILCDFIPLPVKWWYHISCIKMEEWHLIILAFFELNWSPKMQCLGPRRPILCIWGLNLQKTIYEKLYTNQTSTVATTEFLGKTPNRKKISKEHFNFCETKISSIKSINSETNNKSPGNDGLTAEFY